MPNLEYEAADRLQEEFPYTNYYLFSSLEAWAKNRYKRIF